MRYLLLYTTATLVVAVATAEACESCKKDYVFGKPAPVGNGMAFTWARMDKKTNKPISIGLTLTESALTGLPAAKDLDPKMPKMEMILQMPSEIKGMPYDYVTLDWNPEGHIPTKIYDTPHFDFHFFTIPNAERMKITARGKDKPIARKAPAKGMIPAGYILPPDTEEPMMGAHWIDPKSPEFNGQPFTSTFIYGSYNGKLSFVEPMITLAFLESKPKFVQKLSAPSAASKTGYYPSQYSVKWDEARKEYTISLEDLRYVKAQSAAIAKKPAPSTSPARVAKR